MDDSSMLEWKAGGYRLLEIYMKQFAGVYTYQDDLSLADVLFFASVCWSKDSFHMDFSDHIHITRVQKHLLKFEEFVETREYIG